MTEIKPDHPNVASGVRLEDVTFHSAALNREMPYRVFLPSDPGAKGALPVVYLLHGGGDDFRTWSNNTGVSKYAAGGLVLVMPEGNLSYYVNAAGAKNERYEDYMLRDLIADVESRFPVRRGRSGRAIIGISMGGYAAIYYAFSRPDLFTFAAAISAAVDVPSRRFNWKHIDEWWRFRRIFGPVNSSARRSRDPFLMVQESDPREVPYIYLTYGERETFAGPIRRFGEQLKRGGFAYELHTSPGGHNWNEWNTLLPGCFEKLSGLIVA